jgi:hypothetical protein
VSSICTVGMLFISISNLKTCSSSKHPSY